MRRFYMYAILNDMDGFDIEIEAKDEREAIEKFAKIINE